MQMMEFFFPAVVIKRHTHAEQALLQREAHLDINNTRVSVSVCVDGCLYMQFLSTNCGKTLDWLFSFNNAVCTVLGLFNVSPP